MHRNFLLAGAVLGFLGVAIGAFGAVTPIGGLGFLIGWACLGAIGASGAKGA